MDAKVGRTELICGPMFSGKTEEMLRRCERARLAGQTVQWLVPSLDRKVQLSTTNGGQRMPPGYHLTPVRSADSILPVIMPSAHVIAVDDVQTFETKTDGAEGFQFRLTREVRDLQDRGLRVLLCGLDQQHWGAPYPVTGELLAFCQSIKKLTAVCGCGSQFATQTTRLPDGRWAARCRDCWIKEMHEHR